MTERKTRKAKRLFADMLGFIFTAVVYSTINE